MINGGREKVPARSKDENLLSATPNAPEAARVAICNINVSDRLETITLMWSQPRRLRALGGRFESQYPFPTAGFPRLHLDFVVGPGADGWKLWRRIIFLVNKGASGILWLTAMTEQAGGGRKRMVGLVLFRDFDPYYKVDDSGFNKIGVILDDNTVIHPRLSRMTKTSLSKIKSKKHAIFALSESAGFNPDKISSFFKGNVLNSELINAAHEALVKGDIDFFERPIRLPILTGAANEIFEERWLEFVKRLRPGDLIMTFDTRSPISRFIAWIDQGTWSHAGCYAGNGRIIEAVTAGVLERNIEVYHSPRFRLAIYRIDPPATT